jgi:hypothetical protein
MVFKILSSRVFGINRNQDFSSSSAKALQHYSCGQLKPTNWLSREPDFLAKIWRRIWNRTGKRSSKMVSLSYSHGFSAAPNFWAKFFESEGLQMAKSRYLGLCAVLFQTHYLFWLQFAYATFVGTQSKSFGLSLSGQSLRLLKPFARTAHMGLNPMIWWDQMRPNINQINKTSPKLAVERLAQVGFGDLGDLE